jgi:hypothetical protein
MPNHKASLTRPPACKPSLFPQNMTAAPLKYRQATPNAAWQPLPALSAAGLVLLSPVIGATEAPEVELRDADPVTSGSAVCRLDSTAGGGNWRGASAAAGASGSGAGEGGGRGPAGGARPDQPSVFDIDGGRGEALAQVLPEFESVMAAHGPQEVPGSAGNTLGRTQTDALLRVVPKPPYVSIHQLHLAATVSGQEQVRAAAAVGGKGSAKGGALAAAGRQGIGMATGGSGFSCSPTWLRHPWPPPPPPVAHVAGVRHAHRHRGARH